jgi:hypothetical protein
VPVEFVQTAAQLGWSLAQTGPDGTWMFDIDDLIDGGWVAPSVVQAADADAARALAKAMRHA